MLHLTGITPALGPGPLQAVERAIEIARAAGTLVSFDVNYRSKLWSADEAGPVLAGLAGSVDLLFAGPEEAALLLGWDSSSRRPRPSMTASTWPADWRNSAPAPSWSNSARSARSALSGDHAHRAPTRPVTVVDAVGAGDAFVAGYLSEHVAGGSVAACLAMGNRLGGAVCEVPGDWEGLPTRDELNERGQTGDVIR